MDQLVKKEVIADSFSLCYGGMGFRGGAMVLGEISPPPGMIFSYSDSNRRYMIPVFPYRLKSCVFASCYMRIAFGASHAFTLALGWQ